MERQLPHGASTGTDGNEAYSIFSAVVDNLENIEARQKHLLQKCKVKEMDAQGKGLHIFIPGKHEEVLSGTKNQLRPMITDTPIQVHCPKRWEKWNKFAISQKTVEDCCQWNFPPLVGGLENVGDIYKLVSYFICNSSDWKDSFFQTEYIRNEFLSMYSSHSIRNVCSLLHQFAAANLVSKGCKTSKRV